MNRAFIFPGQGSQIVGMGKDFYNNFQIAADSFKEVDDALNYKLSKIIFEGPEEDLTLTYNTQPALMAVSLAILNTIKYITNKNFNQLCSYSAGHSLGEYSALCGAGCFSISDAAKLLKIRGENMYNAFSGNGAMAACLGINIEELNTLISSTKGEYICEIANDNVEGQIVISGHAEIIDLIIKELQKLGKKAVKLKVSSPFHSSLMQPAILPMQEALNKTMISMPSVPIIMNFTANCHTKPAEIIDNLVKQICGTVQWRQTLNKLRELEVEEIVEIGSGKVLSNIIKKGDYNFITKSISNILDLEKFLKSEK